LKKEVFDIIKKSIEGDASAQRKLYEQHRVQWFMICLRYAMHKMQAEDIFQEGLIQIYRDMHQFDPQKSQFITWSSKLIVHTALRFIKKDHWKNSFQNLDDYHHLEDDQENIYDKLTAKELTLMIQQLPTGYRLVLNTYSLEGFKHHEIANLLEISEGTSKSQLSKARKYLKKLLEQQFKISS
jgi:RNA polymerase sigma-70 factor (ECF subfamily)